MTIKIDGTTSTITVSKQTGPVGPAGPEGQKGDTGAQGTQGIQGVQGLLGPTGNKGDQGTQGIQGIVGPTGPQGSTGPQGPAGTADTSTVNGLIDTRVNKSFVDALNVDADTLDGVNSTAFEQIANKNQNNGYAGLDSAGKVPTAQLPSYVDDVEEYANFAAFPGTGETGKIYIAIDTGDVYRWSGSAYVQINDAVTSADQATKLATARNIALTGPITGTASFDGTANANISTSLDISSKSTSDLSEGSNKYYTDARVQTKIDANSAGFITASSSSALTNKTGAISQWTNDAGYLTSESDSQTLSFSTPTLTISNGNNVNLSTLTNGLITASSTDTLTNKTLTAPTITGTAVMETLDISGNADIDGTLEAATIRGTSGEFTSTGISDVITVIGTGDSANEGPDLVIKRNSASPADNDILGAVVFKGENDADQAVTYGKIRTRILDVTDGEEDGQLEFMAEKAGSITSLAKLDSTTLCLNTGLTLSFEGATPNAHETSLTVVDPTADRTITLPNATGTVVLKDTTDTLTNKSGNISQWTNDAGYITSETDSQSLSFSNPNLSISNGNSVDLSALTPSSLAFSAITSTPTTLSGYGITDGYTNANAVSAVVASDLDMGGNKVLFANMYSAEGNLPNATTYHGMFAHVHGTGKGYFAHGGNWIKLIDETSSDTDDLSEGTTNKYYTDARVDARIAAGGSNPTISSISPTTIGNFASTITVTGSNFDVGSQVEFINTSTGIWYPATTIVYNNSTSLTVTITLSVDAQYRMRVENGTGKAVISSANILTVSDAPTWSTAAGSLGSFAGNFSGTIATLSASSDSAVTFSEVGSNLSGANVTLSSAGVLATTDFGGSSTSPTTYNFTIRVTDAEAQTADRSFSFASTFGATGGGQFN